MKNQFSYFKKPITNTEPLKSVSLVEVYDLLRSETFLKRTARLRAIEDPKEARNYKAQNFDYVTFSGIFSRRNDTALARHSGYLTFDFDHLEDVGGLKQVLLADLCLVTELLFVSPSGNGLKWIIKADLSQLTHQAYFSAVTNYLKSNYNLTPDPSGKDLSRACFLSYDPEAYIHAKHLKEDEQMSRLAD